MTNLVRTCLYIKLMWRGFNEFGIEEIDLYKMVIESEELQGMNNGARLEDTIETYWKEHKRNKKKMDAQRSKYSPIITYIRLS